MSLQIETILKDFHAFKHELFIKLNGVDSHLCDDKVRQKVRSLKQTADEITRQLSGKIAKWPAFTVQQIDNMEERLAFEEKTLDTEASKKLVEQETQMARLREAMSEIEDKRDERKEEETLIHVKAQSELAQIRVEQQIEEESNCCTRIFCCLFPAFTQKKMDNLSRDKQDQITVTKAAIINLETEQEKLLAEKNAIADVENEKIDKLLDEKIDVVKQREMLKAKEERRYNEYKLKLDEDTMILMIRMNSCVRRFSAMLKYSEKIKASAATPMVPSELIKETTDFIDAFDTKLEQNSLNLFCIDPDDDTHKIDFKEFYRRYRYLYSDARKNEEEKLKIISGVMPDEARSIIFKWELPGQVPVPVSAGLRF